MVFFPNEIKYMVHVDILDYLRDNSFLFTSI